jgi:hypothetical protein
MLAIKPGDVSSANEELDLQRVEVVRHAKLG